ncbi:unnamed protein product [Ectocarpus sp. 13 AM-2016]
MQDGPAVFRPPLELITHGRASTAPARGRRSQRGTLVARRRPTTATTDTGSCGGSGNRWPLARAGGTASRELGTAWAGRLVGSVGDVASGSGRGVAGGGVARPGNGGSYAHDCGPAADSIHALQQQQQQLRRRHTQRSPHPGPHRGISCKRFLEDYGDGIVIGRAAGRANKGRNALAVEVVGKPGAADSNRAAGSATSASSAAAVAAEGVEESQSPWVLGLRDEWWPAAMSAVEDGARLNIYTGSVLDGRWLNSLDTRLTRTMRATRR